MREQGGEDALYLITASPLDHFAGDVFYPYRPDDNLVYLTGIDEPRGALLLSANELGELGREILFYTPQDPRFVIWEGRHLSPKELADRTGIRGDSVLTMDELDPLLKRELTPRRPLFFAARGFEPGEPVTAGYGFLQQAIGSNAFRIRIESPRLLTLPLRQVKSDAEIAMLRYAIDTTTEALRRAMRAVRPGQHEYHLRSVIEGTFLEHGCSGWGFPSIVGSGPNSCILHYQRYGRKIEDGDLVLMDVGAEYGFYSADVTRTIPANGRFTARQKAIYAIVLEVQKACIETVKPGATIGEINAVARRETARGLKAIGLIESDEQVRKYLPHGISHGIGLNVHDPMPIRELAPGMVLTIEPGIYIEEEELGIRIEDDLLVTETGTEVLSAGVPKEIEAIERWMRTRAF